MNSVFFHIGMHKTATTWFEHHFYPQIEGVRLVPGKRWSKIVTKIEAAATAAPTSTIIVASEALGGSIRKGRKPGASLERLNQTLQMLPKIPSTRGVLVGYREQQSWLKSAFAQRAKKEFGVSWRTYCSSFSLEEISWCKSLKAIQDARIDTFPFLYEELVQSPQLLIEDVCKFLGKSVPVNIGEIVGAPSNQSPRSWPGQFAARLLRPPRSRKAHRGAFEQRIARFDSLFLPRRLSFPSDWEIALEADWNALLIAVGEARGRDFSRFARKPR